MRKLGSLIAGIILLHSICWAQEPVPLEGQKAKDSYSLGYDFGANLRSQKLELDSSILFSAIRDALEDRKPVLTPDDMRSNLTQLRNRLMARQDQLYREFVAKNREEGKSFLTANRMKEGVKELPSGLQYRVLVEGTGPTPKLTDAVTVHYRGTLVNGKEFDNSYTRGKPETLALPSLMRGWQEALPLMKTGSKWQIVVPDDLAYGPRQSDRIPPNSTLIFEIELLGIGDHVAAGLQESAHPNVTSMKSDQGETVIQ